MAPQRTSKYRLVTKPPVHHVGPRTDATRAYLRCRALRARIENVPSKTTTPRQESCVHTRHSEGPVRPGPVAGTAGSATIPLGGRQLASAGKDSIASLVTTVHACEAAAVDRSRLVVVHADLGLIEWPGTRELAEAHVSMLGPRFIAMARRGPDMLDQVLIRHQRLLAKGRHNTPPWFAPGPGRWCSVVLNMPERYEG